MQIISNIQKFSLIRNFWNTYSEYICKKIGKMISFLKWIMRYFVNVSSLKIMHCSTRPPPFDYADITWISSSKYRPKFRFCIISPQIMKACQSLLNIIVTYPAVPHQNAHHSPQTTTNRPIVTDIFIGWLNVQTAAVPFDHFFYISQSFK